MSRGPQYINAESKALTMPSYATSSTQRHSCLVADKSFEKSCIRVDKEKQQTFYIGDVDSLKGYLRWHIDKLDLVFLKAIAFGWILILRHSYKEHDSKRETNTPSWWPTSIRHDEPSRLLKQGMPSSNHLCSIADNFRTRYFGYGGHIYSP